MVQHLGYAGVTLLIFISQIIIVPGTEVTMLFAGFNVDTGHLTLIGIIIAGVLGDVLGASAATRSAISACTRRCPGAAARFTSTTPRSSMAHGWFERYGSPAVAVSRLIPVFRSAPPYAAGIVKMPYWRFVSMATLGSVVWITGLAFLGKGVGHKWDQWKHHLDYVDYVVVALIVIGLAWWLFRYVRSRPAQADGDAQPRR